MVQEWKRLRLTAQGGGTVSMSIDGRGELQSVVKIQTSCLLLGILLREALLRQLDAGGDGKDFKLHRKESTHFVNTLNEVQALAQRAREALNLWTKFRSYSATPAHGQSTSLKLLMIKCMWKSDAFFLSKISSF